MQIRIRVTEEEKVAGQPIVDVNAFTYSVNLSVFKINYPFPPTNINFAPLSTPCLSTYGGNYIGNFGLLVSERVSVAASGRKSCRREPICSCPQPASLQKPDASNSLCIIKRLQDLISNATLYNLSPAIH